MLNFSFKPSLKTNVSMRSLDVTQMTWNLVVSVLSLILLLHATAMLCPLFCHLFF